MSITFKDGKSFEQREAEMKAQDEILAPKIAKWYEARPTNAAELTALIEDILSVEHTYSSIVEGVAAAACAAARTINAHPEQGGITGFQASFVMWRFLEHFMQMRGPLRVVRMTAKAPAITAEERARLREQAMRLASDSDYAIIALVDALDAAERERDEWRDCSRDWQEKHGRRSTEIVEEREASRARIAALEAELAAAKAGLASAGDILAMKDKDTRAAMSRVSADLARVTAELQGARKAEDDCDALLRAERAAHAETTAGLLALCDAIAPGNRDVDFVQRAEATRQLEALHRDTITQMLAALDIKDRGVDDVLAACKAMRTERDEARRERDAARKVAAFARHETLCEMNDDALIGHRERVCTCGLDAARRESGGERRGRGAARGRGAEVLQGGRAPDATSTAPVAPRRSRDR